MPLSKRTFQLFRCARQSARLRVNYFLFGEVGRLPRLNILIAASVSFWSWWWFFSWFSNDMTPGWASDESSSSLVNGSRLPDLMLFRPLKTRGCAWICIYICVLMESSSILLARRRGARWQLDIFLPELFLSAGSHNPWYFCSKVTLKPFKRCCMPWLLWTRTPLHFFFKCSGFLFSELLSPFRVIQMFSFIPPPPKEQPCFLSPRVRVHSTSLDIWNLYLSLFTKCTC